MEFNPDLNDPRTQFLITTGLALLGGNPHTNRNFGADVANAGLLGMSAYGSAKQVQRQQQADERAQQQADITSLLGAYKIANDQEQRARSQAFFNGTPYSPSPAYVAIQDKLNNLLRVGAPRAGGGAPVRTGGIAGGGLLTNNNASIAPNANTPSGGLLTPRNGTSMTPGVQYDGNGQPYGSAVSGAMPMPRLPTPTEVSRAPATGANAAPMPSLPAPAPMPTVPVPANAAPGAGPQPQQPTIPQLLFQAGIDPRVAAMWASTPEGENQLYKQLATVYGPHVTNGIMLRLRPNGGTQFLGGAIPRNAVPVVTVMS